MSSTRSAPPDIASFATQALAIALKQHSLRLSPEGVPRVIWLYQSTYSLWYSDDQITILARYQGDSNKGTITLGMITIKNHASARHEFREEHSFGRNDEGLPYLLPPQPATIVATSDHA